MTIVGALEPLLADDRGRTVAARGHPLQTAIEVGLTCGSRPRELLVLARVDVDLEAHPHELRHGTASLLSAAGVPLDQLRGRHRTHQHAGDLQRLPPPDDTDGGGRGGDCGPAARPVR